MSTLSIAYLGAVRTLDAAAESLAKEQLQGRVHAELQQLLHMR